MLGKMKRQDLEKIRSKSLSQLKNEIQEKRQELLDFRLQAALGKLKNVKEVKLKRKDIARILTIIREKQTVS